MSTTSDSIFPTVPLLSPPLPGIESRSRHQAPYQTLIPNLPPVFCGTSLSVPNPPPVFCGTSLSGGYTTGLLDRLPSAEKHWLWAAEA